ncbi:MULTISPECIES: hypothetical protein [Clostridium]|uniref:Sulfurtransferase TusA family protein n=1 Tax=Clostridium senegalense TaxID=1465809 RepID=A0A6M0H6Q4_9CLOT|nr:MULTISPECIES: hypothetical protein [Clostridium]NEU06410.1 hypothetical protein [Clostridium senegalense]
MSYYKMNIIGRINLSDYSNIHDYMEIIGPEDEFTVMMENSNEEDIQVLCNMLQTEKFNILEKGGSENGWLFIRANKKK